eukprot:comp21089_c0_seq1/m.28448 comp21089_c0_seq1/g.28448  ORF comp21089_c0_seq1/g.28448 comp21089_c0_seq1/m.28448 type:complete len:748 (-) comp21089_c0_seq1:518-2761(-)
MDRKKSFFELVLSSLSSSSAEALQPNNTQQSLKSHKSRDSASKAVFCPSFLDDSQKRMRALPFQRKTAQQSRFMNIPCIFLVSSAFVFVWFCVYGPFSVYTRSSIASQRTVGEAISNLENAIGIGILGNTPSPITPTQSLTDTAPTNVSVQTGGQTAAGVQQAPAKSDVHSTANTNQKPQTPIMLTADWLKFAQDRLVSLRSKWCSRHSPTALLHELSPSKVPNPSRNETCLFESDENLWQGPNSDHLQALLWLSLTGRKENLSFGLSGGSSSAGAGQGVGFENVFVELIANQTQDIFSYLGSPANVSVRNIGHGNTDSVWGGLFINDMLIPLGENSTDILFWEYVLNDHVFAQNGPQEAVEVWFRRALRLNPLPAIGMLYLWDTPTPQNHGAWPGGVSERSQLKVVTEYAKRFDIHGFSLGEYCRNLTTIGSQNGIDLLTIKKNFLSDHHHPSLRGHQTSEIAFMYHYTGIWLKIIEEIMKSGPEAGWEQEARAVTTKFEEILANIPKFRNDEVPSVTKPTDPLSHYAMDNRVGAFNTMQPTFNTNQTLELIPCKPPMECKIRQLKIGHSKDHGRRDKKRYLSLPPCSVGTLDFIPREFMDFGISNSENETVGNGVGQSNGTNGTFLHSFDPARYVGLNMVQVKPLGPVTPYNMTLISEMRSNVCVGYNGNLIEPYIPTSPLFNRGSLSPFLYYKRTDTPAGLGTVARCAFMVSRLISDRPGVIQICGKVPYPLTSVVVLYDEVLP